MSQRCRVLRFLRHLRRLVSPGPLGCQGERAAAAYLKKHGLQILERNVRRAHGEIDLVALEGSTLVFVEVKSRTCTDKELTGLEKIDRRKRAALRRASASYRKCAPRPVESYRLDAVTVEFEKGKLRRRVRAIRWYPAIADLDEG